MDKKQVLENINKLIDYIDNADPKQLQAEFEIVMILAKHFDGDREKITKWMDADNLNFGGSSPASLVSAGRAHKVLLWLQRNEEGYSP